MEYKEPYQQFKEVMHQANMVVAIYNDRILIVKDRDGSMGEVSHAELLERMHEAMLNMSS